MKTNNTDFTRIFHFVKAMLFVFAIHFADAQEPGNGFLNIVNLVPAQKNVTVSVMGKELVPGGMRPVDSTGWFIVPSGSHSLSINCEGFKPASGTIAVEDMMSSLYVIYLEPPTKKTDEDDKPIPPQLRIKRCPSFDIKKGHYLEVMSVCATEEPFRMSNMSLALKPFITQEIPDWGGGAFTVQHLGKDIGSCSGAQEKGSYYLLIGTDHLGKFASILVRNEKQELPPWMKKKETTQTPAKPTTN